MDVFELEPAQSGLSGEAKTDSFYLRGPDKPSDKAEPFFKPFFKPFFTPFFTQHSPKNNIS
jgi:hypothetical protein